MDKPISMSVKDYLIRIMSVKMMMSEKTIEAVVNHQFQSANAALADNDDIEISGFGKFFFNQKKAQKKMDKMLSKVAMFTKQMNDESLSDKKRASANVKLNNTLLGIEALKPKLHVEHQSDLRGVEE
jgi:nucleoid DNA-binding protein